MADDDRKPGKLTDDELIAILRKEENAAWNWQTAELTGLRQQALNYYDRKPLGDEVEGQSKVVTSEVADTVESVMPSMMRVFASSDQVAEFSPIEPADEDAAKEATQYVPHVLMRENDGFRTIHDFIKGALLYRLSGVNVDVEEIKKPRTDAVQGWTAEQLAMAEQIAREQGADEVEIEVAPDEPGTEPLPGTEPRAEMAMLDGEIPPPEPVPTYSGTITVTRTRKRVVVDNIAEEDVLIAPAIRDIDKGSFGGYRKQTTASELRKLGLSKEHIDGLSQDRPVSSEEDQRQDGFSVQNNERKDDQRKLWLVVAYVLADDDGDGISERLRVVYAHAGGNAGRIIERMEWEEPEVPMALATPILMPHTVLGRGLFDQTQDIQDVKTALTRAMLDNTYQVVRPRPMVNSRVNIGSVLDWTAGMPITIDGNGNPAENISFLQTPSILGEAQAGLQYFDTVREARTGVNRDSGVDPNALQNTAYGAGLLASAAAQRMELMARVLAATAMTRLMRLIYRAIKRAATGPTQYHANGDWQTCDPTKWPDDMHLVVSVGPGTGNKMQEIQNLGMIGQAQEKLAQFQGGLPIVTPKHAANTVRKLVEAMGIRNTGAFVANEKEIDAAMANGAGQTKPDPEMLKVQAQAAAAAEKQKSDTELAHAKLQSDIALQQQRTAADMQAKREQAALDLQLSREKAALEMQLAREKAALDAQLKREEIEREAELEAYKISRMPQPGNIELRQQEVS